MQKKRIKVTSKKKGKIERIESFNMKFIYLYIYTFYFNLGSLSCRLLRYTFEDIKKKDAKEKKI